MVVDKVLQCPACKASARTISIQSNEDGGRFLHCSSCSRRFAQDKDNGFFSFFVGARQSEGSPMLQEQREGNFFTNKRFMKLCLDSLVFHVRQTLGWYASKVILDVGCDTGKYALNLKDLYHQYYGLEPFSVSAEFAVDQTVFPENAVLIQYNSTSNLPVNDDAADMMLLLASYDHIPNPESFMKDAYGKIKDGGYLLILCSNYNFWAKRLANKITGKKMFQHRDTHFRVHSPDSLINEIQSFVHLKAEYVNADFFFLPNVPKSINFLYFSINVMAFVNSLLKHIFSLLSIKDGGSGMIVVFKKDVAGK